MLEMTLLDKEQMVSHKRSTTFSRGCEYFVTETALSDLFPNLFNGIHLRRIWRDVETDNVLLVIPIPRICAMPHRHSRAVLCRQNIVQIIFSERYSCTLYCNQAWQESIGHRSAALPPHRHSDTPGCGDRVHWDVSLSDTSSTWAYWFDQIQLHPGTSDESSSPCG